MSTAQYSEDELNELTEAERLALLDGESGDDKDDELEIKGLGDDGKVDDAEDKAAKADDGDAAAVVAGDAVADDGAAAAPVVVADAAGAEPTKSAEPAAAPLQVAPVFVAAAPEDAEVKLAALDARRTDARTQYNSGDIDHDAYEAIKDQIAEEKLELKLAIQTAQIAATMQEQATQQQWYATANQFAATHGYNANPILYKAFESTVVDIAKSEAGATMGALDILEEARKQMAAAGLGKPVAAAADPAPAEKTAAAKPLKPVQPPNLALVPAAATASTDQGKYAALDRLQTTDPDRYEEEFMKMSEAAQDAYLRAAG